MKVDAFASAPHYLDHIAPIWHALPESVRGTFYLPNRLVDECRAAGIRGVQRAIPRDGTPIITASFGDYQSASGRPSIFVEHGAGQRYEGMLRSPGYAGGDGRGRVVLFICPSDRVASANISAYPHVRAVACGCPKLDVHCLNPRTIPANPPTICFTFHADYDVAPETHTGFHFFRSAVQLVRDAGYHVLGHGHPRLYHRIKSFYAALRIPSTPDAERVLREADVLCVDNSSIGFEAASIGIRLVWMSPPFYRRNVHHGLRFWDGLILGEHAESAGDVPNAIARALAPVSPDLYHAREQFLDEQVYSHRDGKAALRASEAIVEVLHAS